jgi:hypothetical protein
MVEAAYRRHLKSPVTTAYKAYTGRDHCMLMQPRWEEIADFAIEWASRNQRTTAARP